MFFNVGGLEILVIAMVALIAVGPEQLPSVMRKVGGFVAEARAMTTGLRDEFMSGLDEVNDLANPEKWMGSGSTDDPVVPRGYAQDQSNGSAPSAEASDEVAMGAGSPGASTVEPPSDELLTSDDVATEGEDSA
jgi:sec-independent protein translocase protein TatB